MRLINADELKKEFCKDIMGGLNWERIIDNAPEIKDVFTLGEMVEAYKKGRKRGLNQWEQQRPHGEWIDEDRLGWAKCSLCGKYCQTDNFCSNCGADMREV